MKRFRISIYADVQAASEEEAKNVGLMLARHLSNPNDNDAPDNYYNPYFGGAGEMITGDLLGNHERLKDI